MRRTIQRQQPKKDDRTWIEKLLDKTWLRRFKSDSN